MQSPPRPALLPLAPNRVWRTYQGGAVLDRLEGAAEPRDGHYPEDWVGSTTAAINPGEHPAGEGLARLAGGDQRLFRDVLASDPAGYLGAAHVAAFGPEPRLLVKLLDSAVRLHFQAHPTAAFARQAGLGTSGKAEAYYILEARADTTDPYVYLGFQRPPTRERLKAMIEAQDVDGLKACFDRIAVRPGDCLFIPGGRPHAIGPGILMVEIMEPSDLAVRFEFAKGGYVLPEEARFMGRGLDFCLDVFDLEPLSVEAVRTRHFPPPRMLETWPGGGLRSLIDATVTPCFRVRRADYAEAAERTFDAPTWAICVGGRGVLEGADARLEVSPYDRFFIPCGARLRVWPAAAEGALRILECLPPEPG